jgi:hypothetical protein
MGKNQSKQAKKEEKESLSESELNALVISTKMSKEEIIKWHNGFINIICLI